MDGMKVGCGTVDITPAVGAALSGFIARMGKPSTGIADRLALRALVLQSGVENYFLLNYDLLCIGLALREKILKALARRLGTAITADHCVITTTHTHSGPVTMAIEGEVEAPAAYLDYVADQTVDAVEQALYQAVPVVMEQAALSIPGFTYNRRSVLADGRVSILLEPEAAVLSRGSLDDQLTVLRWTEGSNGTEPGRTVAGLAHFSCHGVAMMTQEISADIPGELARRIGKMLGAPCLFLQGATGDVNPRLVRGDRAPMLAWCDQFMAKVGDLSGRFQPVAAGNLVAASTELSLEYDFPRNREELERIVAGWERIGQGEMDSADLRPARQALADLLNIKPGDPQDPVSLAFTAKVLAGAGRRTLSALDASPASGEYPGCLMPVAVWTLGGVRLVFLCGEMFAVTGLKIRKLDETRLVLPVSYVSPVVGYIPDRESIQNGGYEVDSAWRFYRQPAPFAADTEERIVDAVRTLINEG